MPRFTGGCGSLSNGIAAVAIGQEAIVREGMGWLLKPASSWHSPGTFMDGGSITGHHGVGNVILTLTLLLTVMTGAAHGEVDVHRPLHTQIPALGAHTLLVQTEGKGISPAITVPITTQAQGSSLLVLVSSYTSNSSDPIDNYANTWKQLGRSVVYDGYEGRFNARAYVALSARGGMDHVVSIAKNGRTAGEISVPFIEIQHAAVLQSVAQNYPVPGIVNRAVRKLARAWGSVTQTDPDMPVTLTSGTVTTTGPAALVAVWWGDATVLRMTAVPDNGFKVIDSFLDLPPNSGVQCAVAFKQVAAAGVYHVSWAGVPAQGAILWLFAFQSSH